MPVNGNSLKNLRPRAARSAERRAELEREAREMETSIEAMAGNGLSPQQISLLTGLAPDRLYRRYRGAMMKGGAKRTNEVAESAFKMAVGGPEKNWRQADAGMAKFWLERLGGSTWAPRGRDEDDGPDLSRLTVAQLIELERALRPLARTPGPLIEGTGTGARWGGSDGTVERTTESRAGRGGVDEAGAGDHVDGGDGEHLDGEGAVRT